MCFINNNNNFVFFKNMYEYIIIPEIYFFYSLIWKNK